MNLESTNTSAAVHDDSQAGRNQAEILLRLQLGVARRADAFARRCPASQLVDRQLWLRAEQEIFELAERAAPGIAPR